jgi:long-subunit acyl-CoA synthetase (AMP-forming)
MSAGVARSGIEVRILDPEDTEVPRGHLGEVAVRGPAVMRGYWRQPEATADALRMDGSIRATSATWTLVDISSFLIARKT